MYPIYVCVCNVMCKYIYVMSCNVCNVGNVCMYVHVIYICMYMYRYFPRCSRSRRGSQNLFLMHTVLVQVCHVRLRPDCAVHAVFLSSWPTVAGSVLRHALLGSCF